MPLRLSATAYAVLICLASFLPCSGRASAVATEASLFRLRTSTGHVFKRTELPPDALLIVYFGFSTCWRYCPMALNNIATAIDSLDAHTTAVRPVFVDLDPAKTTRSQLTRYLRSYGQRFVGLTGTSYQLQTAAANFGVTLQKQQFSADPMDYAMTHTSPIILWNLRTETRTTLPANCPTACILDAVEAEITTARRSTEPFREGSGLWDNQPARAMQGAH